MSNAMATPEQPNWMGERGLERWVVALEPTALLDRLAITTDRPAQPHDAALSHDHIVGHLSDGQFRLQVSSFWQGSVSPSLEGTITPSAGGSIVEFRLRVPRAGWRYWLEHFAVVAGCLQILGLIVAKDMVEDLWPESAGAAAFALIALAGVALSAGCFGCLAWWYARAIRSKAAKLLRFWRNLVDDVRVLEVQPAVGDK
jgi:hypothetical protein